ncbi:hypothetical protein HIM_04358 [Hirsutella minnesotensis 3608]|uniref:Pentacotripeptide-repeat region of PRORP domain-containing protein n=1 Tax=Hirsutella minnesotensis 3608 TaxID=1043627 RepID=A0A0F7ZLD3_9HYPO|nr:hypothetical protein HIM_04358 [Hirsutella minnesotensis 3608]
MPPWTALLKRGHPRCIVTCPQIRLSHPRPCLRQTYSRLASPPQERHHPPTTPSPFEDAGLGHDDGSPVDYAQLGAAQRNRLLKGLFTAKSPAIHDATASLLSSPFVPVARQYPTERLTKVSLREARFAARRQLAFKMMKWRPDSYREPVWRHLLDLLKTTTPKPGSLPTMTALRLVLPGRWKFPAGDKELLFVDSATALTAKLRISLGSDPSTIVLRGRSEVLARVADELVASIPGIHVFKLGDVATFDYETKRLWPMIDPADEDGTELPKDSSEGFWAHQERSPSWIEHRYEDTPEPDVWTKETFGSYIETLVCGRLRSHLSIPLYSDEHPDRRTIDTDGKRIKMILDAFRSSFAAPCITPFALKMAVAFMVSRGGHRADAEKLLKMAEENALPLDADFYNIMLKGYVENGDVGLFHKTLRQMEARHISPNARTWLHFLSLVKKDDEKRQIVAAMFDLGLYDDPATRRGVAEGMAGIDAYEAFKAGKTLGDFVQDQENRYGKDWFTVGALNSIVVEYMRFRPRGTPRTSELETLMQRRPDDGGNMDLSTAHCILEQCSLDRDWRAAFWVMLQLPRFGAEPVPKTYEILINLAYRTRTVHCMSILFAYGALNYMIGGRSREQLIRLLLEGKATDHFWIRTRPNVLTQASAETLQSERATAIDVLRRLEKALRADCRGYTPAVPLGRALSDAYHERDLPGYDRPGYERWDIAKDWDRGAAQKVVLSLEARDQFPRRKQVILSRAFDPATMFREPEVTDSSADSAHEPSPDTHIPQDSV